MNKNYLRQTLLEVVNDFKKRGMNQLSLDTLKKAAGGRDLGDYLQEISSFMKGFDLCLKELGDHLSQITITKRYNEILEQLSESKSPSQLATQLVENLEKEISLKKEFKVYIPIREIELFEGYVFEINSLSKIVYLNSVNTLESIPENQRKEFFPYSIEIIIQTSDHLKAMEIAEEASKAIVHFLRMVDYQGWDEELLGLRIPGYGTSTEELHVMAVPATAEKLNSYYSNFKEAHDDALEIDHDFIEKAKEIGLNRFGEILIKFIKNDLNDMETQVMRSIIWFGESKIEHDKSARFLKLSLVLECLLNLSKNEPVTLSLSERVAFILEDSLEKRVALAARLSKLYSVRSQIVHNGSSNVEVELLFELEQIVFQLIKKFLTQSKYASLETKKQLKIKMNEIKFS